MLTVTRVVVDFVQYELYLHRHHNVNNDRACSMTKMTFDWVSDVANFALGFSSELVHFLCALQGRDERHDGAIRAHTVASQ